MTTATGTAKPAESDFAREMRILSEHDEVRAGIVRKIENLQAPVLTRLLKAFDTPANREAIDQVRAMLPELTDARQGQASQLVNGFESSLNFLVQESARLDKQVAADARTS